MAKSLCDANFQANILSIFYNNVISLCVLYCVLDFADMLFQLSK